MSERPIKFKYQKGLIVGGYSFSAYDNIITFSEYVQQLENEKIREAIQYEAKTAHSFYIYEVKRLKANGEMVKTSRVKYEAIKRAKEDAKIKYADIWDDVEDTYKHPPPLSVEIITHNAENDNPNIILQKGVNFIVVVAGSDNLLDSLIETIETHNKNAKKCC